MAGSTTNYGLTKPADGEDYDVDITNNNSDITDTQIFNRSLQAEGLKYQHEIQANSSSASDFIVSHIATFTFKGGRKYRIVWDFSHLFTVATDVFFCSIGTCATTDSPTSTAGITVRGGRHKKVASANLTEFTGAITAYYNPVADNTFMVKFRALRAVGSGNFSARASSTEISVYSIYDDGKQF